MSQGTNIKSIFGVMNAETSMNRSCFWIYNFRAFGRCVLTLSAVTDSVAVRSRIVRWRNGTGV